MGCVSSKRFLRTTSFQENLKRPFPPVTAIPILDDLVLANSHEFVALICKANKLAKKFPAPSEAESVFPFISKDSEGEKLTSGNHVRVNSDLQSESSLKAEKTEKHEAAEGGSEENKPTEKDKTEIIFTWELMAGLDNGETYHVSSKTGPDSDSLSANSSDLCEEDSEEYKPTEKDKTYTIFSWELMAGLDDGETYHVSRKNGSDSDSLSANSSDICEELIDKSVQARISGFKSLESFHRVEKYDVFLARRKRPLWDRNSKRHFYYLGHEHIETINEFSSTSLSRLYSGPRPSLTERNMIPVVIDWKEESEDSDDCSFEFVVVQLSVNPSDTKNDVNSYISQTASENNSRKENVDITQTVSENNGIAETISEYSGSQENNQNVETNIGNTDITEEKFENDESTETNSGKRRMHVKAKLNDLGGIIIPSTPEFSAVGSFKEWLTGGGHLYSPGVSTGLSLGYSEFGHKWSKANDAGNSGQPSSDGAKMETDYSPVLNIDEKLANDGESSVYSDSLVCGIENKQWDYPLFYPELIASFEKALEQLSEEEQHLLRQLDVC